MYTTQHTIKQSAQIAGIGIHTGEQVTATFLPALTDHGIQFQRIDLPDQPLIVATANYVVATNRSTTLANGNAQVQTVEHVLAAIAGLQIDNVLIQLNGPEVPIIDGSATPFVTLLNKIGLEDQGTPRQFFTITETITHEEASGASFKILPWNGYALNLTLAEDTPILHYQSAHMERIGDFSTTIASARTFAFVHELKELHQQGLIKGGNSDNSLLLADQQYTKEAIDGITKKINKRLNVENIVQLDATAKQKLRYPNEPAKHKLLDVIGDLALVGRPIQGHIITQQPSHTANIAFAKKLRKLMIQQEAKGAPIYNVNKLPILDVQQINKLLPHRYPFQLVDKIIHLNATSIAGVKNITINEPFFQGHFPGTPIMPGVLQVEALIQAGGILILNTVPDPENYLTYFLGIDECKFRKMVVPGDTLLLQCQLLTAIKYNETATAIRSVAKVKGKAFVGNQLVSEATMLAQIVKEKA